MKQKLDVALAILVPVIVLFYLSVTPFTKVEESFNIQATRDILAHGIRFKNTAQYLKSRYDHLTFTGSVPRTFVGPLALAVAAWPFASSVHGIDRQILVRAILGIYNSFCILAYRNAVAKSFGRVTANWYLVLQMGQFHVMFWASRTLPNFFAFGLSTLALRSLLPPVIIPASNTSERYSFVKERRRGIIILTVLGVVFRSEIAILLFAYVVAEILQRHLNIRQILTAGITGAVIGLCATIPIDSFYWQRFPLWPEFSGFVYNILDSKASDWGTSPWHYYFSVALPKLLFNPYSIIGVAANVLDPYLSPQGQPLVLPGLAFVAIYSFIPHKEWRFIVYVIPPLTAAAARFANHVSIRSEKSPLQKFNKRVYCFFALAAFAASLGLLLISSLNYPGAEALNRLHAMAHGTQPVIKVHMDTLSCMTGVTRFLQIPNAGLDGVMLHSPEQKLQTIWIYDKTDNETELLKPEFWLDFDYVLTEDPKRVPGAWDIVHTTRGYGGLMFLPERGGYGQFEDWQEREERLSRPWSYGEGPWVPLERILGGEQGFRARVQLLAQFLTIGIFQEVKMKESVQILKKAKLLTISEA